MTTCAGPWEQGYYNRKLGWRRSELLIKVHKEYKVAGTLHKNIIKGSRVEIQHLCMVSMVIHTTLKKGLLFGSFIQMDGL